MSPGFCLFCLACFLCSCPGFCKSCVFWYWASPPSVCYSVYLVILFCLLYWLLGLDPLIVFSLTIFLPAVLLFVLYLIIFVSTPACLTLILNYPLLNHLFTALCIWVLTPFSLRSQHVTPGPSIFCVCCWAVLDEVQRAAGMHNRR